MARSQSLLTHNYCAAVICAVTYLLGYLCDSMLVARVPCLAVAAVMHAQELGFGCVSCRRPYPVYSIVLLIVCDRACKPDHAL